MKLAVTLKRRNAILSHVIGTLNNE